MTKEKQKTVYEMQPELKHQWEEMRFCARMLALGKARIRKGIRHGRLYRYTEICQGEGGQHG